MKKASKALDADAERHYRSIDEAKTKFSVLSKHEESDAPGWNRNTTYEMPAALDKEMRSPITKLLRKEQDVKELQAALELRKAEFQLQQQAFANRDQDIAKRNSDNEQALVYFDKYLKDTQHKRRYAEQVAQQESQKIVAKTKELTELNDHRAALLLRLEDRKLAVAKRKKYLDYLSGVYEFAHENLPGLNFDDVSSILKRHDTLQKALRKLEEQKEATIREADEYRLLIAGLQKQQQARPMATRQVNDLAERLEAERRMAGADERALKDSAQLDKHLRQSIYSILLAVDNLYDRCRRMELKHDTRPAGAAGASSTQTRLQNAPHSVSSPSLPGVLPGGSSSGHSFLAHLSSSSSPHAGAAPSFGANDTDSAVLTATGGNSSGAGERSQIKHRFEPLSAAERAALDAQFPDGVGIKQEEARRKLDCIAAYMADYRQMIDQLQTMSYARNRGVVVSVGAAPGLSPASSPARGASKHTGSGSAAAPTASSSSGNAAPARRGETH